MDEPYSAGLSWEAIGIVLGGVGFVVTVAMTVAAWAVRSMVSTLKDIRKTLKAINIELAVLSERWRAGDEEHGRFRETLVEHDGRIGVLENGD